MPLQITPDWYKYVPHEQVAELTPLVARINARLVQIDEELLFEDRVEVIQSWMRPLFELGLNFEKTGRAFWVEIESMNKDIQEDEERLFTACNVLNEKWGWKQDANHVLFELISHIGMGSNQSWTDPIMRFLADHEKTGRPLLDSFRDKSGLSSKTLLTIGRSWDKSAANQLTMGLALWSVYFEDLSPGDLQLIKQIFEYEFDEHNTSFSMVLFVYQVRAWIYMCLCNSKGSEDQFRRMNALIIDYFDTQDAREDYSLFAAEVESSSAESSFASSADSGATASPPPRQVGAAGPEWPDDSWFDDDDGVKYGSPRMETSAQFSEGPRETESTGWMTRRKRPGGLYSTFVV